MNESSVGTAAIAQLAPMVNFVDMDGPLLLAEDVGEGVGFDKGRIVYRENVAGLGISMAKF